MRIVDSVIDVCYLAKILMTLDGTGIECLCILYKISQFDTCFGIKVSDFWVNSHPATFNGIKFLIGTLNHSFTPWSRDTQHVTFSFIVDPEVFVTHTSNLYYLSLGDILSREYIGEILL